ncbi:hypothetical protein ETU09_04300 [Apibacter muscae]|uniref:DNA 3'-5' helicase n=1 Tax=Apibacter muscae TaxID=2509004 RepID=A0A563DG73_9FLAO|nr:UvrD-helicase domain-containing protein [Apibacter muscae]TWP29069.1 hypothetical protein ETU09_04300 [Apibacter muscae]
METNYTIYNASAGAGKTFTLVKKFVTILLKDENLDTVRSVLAVTFTNKAANEMKVRILNWLKEFSDKTKYKENIVLKLISEELGISLEILNQRAYKTLSYLLHHYSLLSVSTIDKFNLRLMKSFTKELGLSYSFSVELDASEYLKQSIDELVYQLGTENPFAEVILNYIFWKFENESTTDIRKELLSSSQNFLKEMHLENLESVTQKDFEDFKKLNQILVKRIKSNHDEVINIAKKIVDLIQTHGLEASDFYQGKNGMGAAFYKIALEGNIFLNFESANYKKFCEEEKYAKAKSPKEDDIKLIAPEMIKAFNQIKQLVNRIKIDESVRKNLITLELQSEITGFLDQKKEENDVVFLSDVNKLISRHLKEEPVAFIYEKLGGRYNHYFIDEFQDTSQLQWDNFLPLIENAKVSDGTSITLVGDLKQAIYRFRSGKPEILIDLISSAEEKNIQIENLQNNYRSLPNVVDFNNQYYQFLANTELSNPDYKDLFGNKLQQISFQKEGGRVQVSFVPPKEEEDDFMSERVVEIIEESLSNGFAFQDIVILVRNKNHSYSIVEKIIEKGYPILTEEALLVASSPAIQAIIYAFRWIEKPEDKVPLIRMLYQLYKLDKIKIQDFTEEILKLQNLSFTEILKFLSEEFNLQIHNKQSNNLSFYDFAEEFINSLNFGSKEDLYISALLDMILQFEKNSVLSLSEFLEHWEIKSKGLSIRFPEHRNAIQIMTIHKSKGLEFPLVIYPRYEKRKSNSEEYWFPLEEDLYEGFDKYYTSSKSNLDETNEEIKQVIDKQEFEKKIDELCIEYVATTRAVQQLFLLIEQKSEKSISSISSFLANQGHEAKGVIELYPNTHFTNLKPKDKDYPIEDQMIQWYSGSWNQKLKVSSEIHKFYREENKEIQYGNAIHAILAEIETLEDLPLILKKYIYKGVLESENLPIVKELITNLVIHKDLKIFFSEEVRIYKEQEILWEHKFYRPDRLVELNGEFHILDFKTGQKLSKHKKQIESYENALLSMGKRINSKQLIYLLNSEIEIIKL